MEALVLVVEEGMGGLVVEAEVEEEVIQLIH
jgi:hypothetical protein